MSYGAIKRFRNPVIALVLTVIMLILIALAVQADGRSSIDMSLNDGSIWVVNEQTGAGGRAPMIGRLNLQTATLDHVVPTVQGLRALGVDQGTKGARVDLVLGSGKHDIRTIDEASGVMSEPLGGLPDESVLAMGGSMVAILAPGQQARGWVISAANLASWNDQDASVALRADTVVVGDDGAAYFVDSTNQKFTRVDLDDTTSAYVKSSPQKIQGNLDRGSRVIERAVIGRTYTQLVADSNGDVYLQRAGIDPVEIKVSQTSQVRLQQSVFTGTIGERAAVDKRLYVATDTGLYVTSLEENEPFAQVVEFSGAEALSPAAPLVADGCVFVAWPDVQSEQAFQAVADTDDHKDRSDDSGCDQRVKTKIPGLGGVGADKLVLRQRRDKVVLNSAGGQLWILRSRQLIGPIEGWSQRLPKQVSTKQQEDDCKDPSNTRPNLRPDNVWSTPGQAGVYAVLDNDSDQDRCDILALSKAPQYVSGVKARQVALVGEGTQLQMQFPQAAKGVSVYRYHASDGREAGALRSTTITIHHDATSNRKPFRLKGSKNTPIKIAAGETVEFYIGRDWADPDGDEVRLKSVDSAGSSPSSSGQVEYRPDGVITYKDISGVAGTRRVDYVVSDGRLDERGHLTVVVVRDGEEAPPQLLPDYVQAAPGSSITIRPLANDLSRDGRRLSLRSVRVLRGHSGSDFDFRGQVLELDVPSVVGSYYYEYGAVAGGGEYPSVVRVEVVAKSEGNRAPIAVRDVADISVGGTAFVDLLANDIDEDEDELAVTRIVASGPSAAKVLLVDRRYARIQAIGLGLMGQGSAPITLSYWASDGRAAAEGTLTIVRTGTTNSPPVVEADSAVVRAGTIARIPVLNNDQDPDGGQLSIKPGSARFDNGKTVDKGAVVWISGRELRVRAVRPGSYVLRYAAQDDPRPRHALTTTEPKVTLNVLGQGRANQAPRSTTATGRVYGSTVTKVKLPLQDLDPDGDPVTVSALATMPQLGRVLEYGTDWISYQAHTLPGGSMVGTDRFQVSVVDSKGAVGRVNLRIAVIPSETVQASRAVAIDDQIRVRPTVRKVSFNVLVNDADPDGDPIKVSSASWAPRALKKKQEQEVEVTQPRLSGSSSEVVTVERPGRDGQPFEGDREVIYEIFDPSITPKRIADQASLHITWAADAPSFPPMPNDDSLPSHEVASKSPGDTVPVNVLENDIDLDGSTQDLKLEVVAGDGARVIDGAKIEVTLAKLSQLMTYRVIDEDQQASYASIHVPGTDTLPAGVYPAAKPLELKSGSKNDIDLDELLSEGKVVYARKGAKLRVKSSSSESLSLVPAHAGNIEAVDKQRQLRVNIREDFVGTAAINALVIDKAQCRQGCNSVLVIPVNVSGSKNSPPTIARDKAIQLEERGEPGSVSFAGDVEDPDGDKVTLRVVRGLGGSVIASAAFSGETLKITVTDEARAGQRGTITVQAEDSQGARSEPRSVSVDVVKSNRPHLQVGSRSLEVTPGSSQSVNVLAGVSNPWDEDEPVTIGAPGPATVPGGFSATVAASGVVTVKAGAADQLQQTSFSIPFEVLDGSDDPTRVARGTVSVTAKAPPSPPGAPSQVKSGSANDGTSVTLQWSSPQRANGTIKGYEIQGGGSSNCGADERCVVTNLDPKQEYTFKVRAKNEHGWGDYGPSASADPDQVPAAPNCASVEPVQIRSGGMAAKIVWSTAKGEGSPVKTFIITGGPTVIRLSSEKATSTVVEGLKNGSDYTFSVRAENAAGESDVSTCPTVRPYGPPLAISAPAIKSLSDGSEGSDGAKIQVSVAPANNSQENGRPVTRYRVFVYENGAQKFNVVGPELQREFTVENAKEYTAVAIAINEGGEGEESGESNSVTPYDIAAAPSVTVQKEALKSATVQVSRVDDLGGGNLVQYELLVDGAARSIGLAPSAAIKISNLTAGSHSFQARVITEVANKKHKGALSNTVTAIVYDVASATISATAAVGSVNFSVNINKGGYPGSVTATWSTPSDGVEAPTSGDVTSAVPIELKVSDKETETKVCIDVTISTTAPEGAEAITQPSQECATSKKPDPPVPPVPPGEGGLFFTSWPSFVWNKSRTVDSHILIYSENAQGNEPRKAKEVAAWH